MPFSNFYNLSHLKKQLITSATPLLAGYPTILIIVSCQMSIPLRDTEKLMVKDSKIQPSAKSVGALLRAGLHPPNEGEEESFLCVGSKPLICVRQRR